MSVRRSQYRSKKKARHTRILRTEYGRMISVGGVRPATDQEAVPRNPDGPLRLSNLTIPASHVSASTPGTTQRSTTQLLQLRRWQAMLE
jgi:hypothetical protein